MTSKLILRCWGTLNTDTKSSNKRVLSFVRAALGPLSKRSCTLRNSVLFGYENGGHRMVGRPASWSSGLTFPGLPGQVPGGMAQAGAGSLGALLPKQPCSHSGQNRKISARMNGAETCLFPPRDTLSS